MYEYIKYNMCNVYTGIILLFRFPNDCKVQLIDIKDK